MKGRYAHVGIVLETDDPERVWNAFRLANTALDAEHTVEVFLLGDAVEAPDLEHETFNPHGVMRKYTRDGGELLACGTCLDSRDLDEDDLRPRATMGDYLRIVEDAEKVLTIG
ncbi:DsrE family protein [Halomarina ordinaria]|uniref:DsrE family protein n=1 Tax=Halomarina ordinaria TaxID=3033939 RepID=A0ABD5U953_9EURY|nr:DsrE family protein [Halomarina sp. PSRA2]